MTETNETYMNPDTLVLMEMLDIINVLDEAGVEEPVCDDVAGALFRILSQYRLQSNVLSEYESELTRLLGDGAEVRLGKLVNAAIDETTAEMDEAQEYMNSADCDDYMRS